MAFIEITQPVHFKYFINLHIIKMCYYYYDKKIYAPEHMRIVF